MNRIEFDSIWWKRTNLPIEICLLPDPRNARLCSVRLWIPGKGMGVSLAELPEVSGTGINVLQNLQKFFVG